MRITTIFVALSLLMASPALAQQQRIQPSVKRTGAPASLRSQPAAPAQQSAPAPAPAAAVTPSYQRSQAQQPAPARQEIETQSQPDLKSGVFKLNVFSPIISTVSAFYEKPLSPTSSAQLGFYYTGAGIGDVSLRGSASRPNTGFTSPKRTTHPTEPTSPLTSATRI